MAELADAADSKSADLRVLGVRLPLPAPFAILVLPNPSASRSVPQFPLSSDISQRARSDFPILSRFRSELANAWGIMVRGSSLFMLCATRVARIAFLFPLLSVCALGQISARLQTTDTELVLEAGPSAPRLVSLTIPGVTTRQNRSSEALISNADVSAKSTPVLWTFNREASQISDQRVAFVYDCATPHLRLTWEWRARQSYGPIEHQIRIENLDDHEIWIPMQDSLAFDWQVTPQTRLHHLFVEKGADTPSAVGTHELALADGYHWTGTSSTYGDLRSDEPREIIPWSLVEGSPIEASSTPGSDATQTGWYAGMLEVYVEKWPTPRIENFRYMLRSGMMGWLTIMIDTNAWSPEQHAEAKNEIALYKELRPFIRDADLYHVSPRPDGVHWDGVEYWNPDRQRGVVYAFRGTMEEEKTHAYVLQGLQPSSRYLLKFNDHSSPDRTVTGEELMKRGLKVTLPIPNSSELIFITIEGAIAGAAAR
jgi:Glycosyl hydrolase family 36 C-terminal domain